MAELKEYVPCGNCLQRYGTHDFHDCKGVFDELRWKLEGHLPNSAWIRVKKKYALRKDDPELCVQMQEYLSSLPKRKLNKLTKEYNLKLKEVNLALFKTAEAVWELEDLLWQS